MVLKVKITIQINFSIWYYTDSKYKIITLVELSSCFNYIFLSPTSTRMKWNSSVNYIVQKFVMKRYSLCLNKYQTLWINQFCEDSTFSKSGSNHEGTLENLITSTTIISHRIKHQWSINLTRETHCYWINKPLPVRNITRFAPSDRHTQYGYAPN